MVKKYADKMRVDKSLPLPPPTHALVHLTPRIVSTHRTMTAAMLLLLMVRFTRTVAGLEYKRVCIYFLSSTLSQLDREHLGRFASALWFPVAGRNEDRFKL
jgi:hypothetical protein